jgi:hypothetical protein
MLFLIAGCDIIATNLYTRFFMIGSFDNEGKYEYVKCK